MKKYILAALALFILLTVVVPMIIFERGDYLGPLERSARAILSGWDMWATESVRPYEDPMPESVPGAVSVDGGPSYSKALAEFEALKKSQLEVDAKLTYDRFCQHCHGPNGDGRVIVGESFGIPIPDLRSPKVQFSGRVRLYDKISEGQENMIPLKESLTPTEILLTIYHIKALKNAPSVPYYSPKNVAPLN